MADQDRTPPADLSIFDALSRDPYGLDFYQVIRRIERENSSKPGFGNSLKSSDDPLRLGQDASLSFAPASIASFSVNASGGRARLGVWSPGLFGPNGALPIHLTEYAMQRQHTHRDRTFAGFADIFHHRFLSLFYRAWANARPVINYERPGRDRYAELLGSLMGMGTQALQDRDAFPDSAKLHYAGWLSSPRKNSEGLESMVEHFFGLKSTVRQYWGEWLDLPKPDLCRLTGNGPAPRLGIDSSIGERVWECQHRFRLVLGVLSFQQFLSLLPGTASLKRLSALVRNYSGDELEWDFQLVLARDEVPAATLGVDHRLGWSTWLGATERKADAGDLVIAGRFAHCDL